MVKTYTNYPLDLTTGMELSTSSSGPEPTPPPLHRQTVIKADSPRYTSHPSFKKKCTHFLLLISHASFFLSFHFVSLQYHVPSRSGRGPTGYVADPSYQSADSHHAPVHDPNSVIHHSNFLRDREREREIEREFVFIFFFLFYFFFSYPFVCSGTDSFYQGYGSTDTQARPYGSTDAQARPYGSTDAQSRPHGSTDVSTRSSYSGPVYSPPEPHVTTAPATAAPIQYQHIDHARNDIDQRSRDVKLFSTPDSSKI